MPISPNISQEKIYDNCKRNNFYKCTIRIATNVGFSVGFYKGKLYEDAHRGTENDWNTEDTE